MINEKAAYKILQMNYVITKRKMHKHRKQLQLFLKAKTLVTFLNIFLDFYPFSKMGMHYFYNQGEKSQCF